jgi:S1-C subfamily serine protease
VPLKLKCPACGQMQNVPDEVMGTKIVCPSCSASLRVPAAKPAAAGDATAASSRAKSATNSPEEIGYGLAPEPLPAVAPNAISRPRPAAAEVSPKPAKAIPKPADAPAGGGLPAWMYAALGGVGVLALVTAAALIRSFTGSAGDPFPDPAVDVVLGIASPGGASLAQPAVGPSSPAPARAAAEVAPSKTADAPPGAGTTPVGAPAGTLATSTVTPPAGRASVTTPAPLASVAPAPAPSTPGVPLTTAQIVARWEPSVALVKGQASSGTGFVIKPGIVVTNAHVIHEELISGLEVRFPSAPAGKQGPLAAELLYEDPKRDLAFLKVETDLPATQVSPNYSFVKGEDITVIGNPGLGDEVVLENAISRGVMSSKTIIDGMNFLQLNISINPGNSGGPVFDSSGRVIGVATLKAAKAEALAFCIPADDLQAALVQVGPPRPDVVSRHRSEVSFQMLSMAGALYGIGLEVRANLLRNAPFGGKPNLLPNEPVQKLNETMMLLDEKAFSPVMEEIANIKTDATLAPLIRTRYQELATTYQTMKDLYAATNKPADKYAAAVQAIRAKHLHLVDMLQKDLKVEVPAPILALMKTKVIDGQPATVITQIVPGSVQSRILRGRISQRGTNGLRKADPPGHAPTARERAQDRRNSRGRGNN